MMYLIPITIIFGFLCTLIHGIWHLNKYPKILEDMEARPNIMRVFAGSVVGIFAGLFLFFIYQQRGFESDGKGITLGVVFLSLLGIALYLYSKKLARDSNFGEANKFLGISYAILASIFLLTAVLFCVLS